MGSLIMLILVSLLIEVAMAADHTVGGTNGKWDTSTNLQTWASTEQVFVGDNLVFQYTPMHDVVEVSKADYDSCSASNPIKTYSGGATTIPLASPGKRYFICGTLGHCSQGMKIEVETLATSPSAPEASPSSPISSPVMPLVPSPMTEFPAPAPAPAESPDFFPEAAAPDVELDRNTNSPALSPFTDPSINESLPPLAESSPAPSAAPTATSHLQTSLTLGFSVFVIILAF